MKYFRININPLTGITNRIKCTFKTENSFPEMIVKHRDLSPYYASLHKFNVKYRENFNVESTWFTTKLLIVIISSTIALTFIWWLNNSNASIPPVSSKLIPKVTSDSAPILIEIPVEIPIKLPDFTPIDNFPTIKLPWLHLHVKSGDTLSAIFKKNNLNNLYEVVQTEHSKQLRRLKINQELHIKYYNNNVKNLILILNKTDELHVFQTEYKEFESEIRPIGRTTKTLSIHGIVKTTFLDAAEQSGLSKQQSNKFIKIFAHHIDFEKNIKIGDQFSLFYKQYLFEDEIEEGAILAAEIINKGKTYQALRYTNKAGYTSYYT
ncbi:MAG: hypothetical protein IMF12_06715, partial [Proteobacteria bacterium]|nr:hypothetical protein [Pseudomonadota bacterium]